MSRYFVGRNCKICYQTVGVGRGEKEKARTPRFSLSALLSTELLFTKTERLMEELLIVKIRKFILDLLRVRLFVAGPSSEAR